MRHLTALDEIAFSEAFRFDLKAVLFVLPRRAFQEWCWPFRWSTIAANGRRGT
jgi:hypothetical protein